jgi:DNA polymerase-3 subunit gamma/tau
MAAPSVRAASESLPQSARVAPALTINTFPELVALAVEKRDVQMKLALERDVRLVRCEDGKLEIAVESTAPKTLVNDLSRKLQQWTGRPWVVVVSREPGEATLKSIADARKAELEVGVRGDPLVKAVMERFPGAEIVRVGVPTEASLELPPATVDMPAADDEGCGDNWVRDGGDD